MQFCISYVGICLSATSKMNIVNKVQHNYVNMQDNHVNLILLHVNIIMMHVKIIIYNAIQYIYIACWHADIIILHVAGRNMPPWYLTQNRLPCWQLWWLLYSTVALALAGFSWSPSFYIQRFEYQEIYEGEILGCMNLGLLPQIYNTPP